ncbi:MAG: transposase [Oculatellaceae cyanobacterium bins.114]|nr:transposase [Oculatellaceae cyanobacterium bins.114]
MGRSRYHFLENHPHFLTCTVVNWLPLFSNPKIVQILFDSLNFLCDRQRIVIHGYVVMENHLHLIASSNHLSKEIKAFKSFTARLIIDWLQANNRQYWLTQLAFYKQFHKFDQDYQVWQEGSHPQALLTAEMFQQKLEYVHHNPIRRGYVDNPGHWCYSSYRDYQEQQGLLPIVFLEV